MPSFSKKSLSKVRTCHIDIQKVCFEAIKIYDFRVLCGWRSKSEQNKAYDAGASKICWPNSKHNTSKVLHSVAIVSDSHAVDIAPYFTKKPHIRWDDEFAFIYLAGHMMAIAFMLGVELRWGGCWRRDKDVTFNKKNYLHDLVHFELIS